MIEVVFKAPAEEYELYVLADPALKNSGYGDTGFTQDGALVGIRKRMSACALMSSPSFSEASSGFVGKSDGYTDLLLHHKLTWKYDRAEKGNIFQVAKLGGAGRYTLALGFGADAAAAIDVAKKSLARKFADVSAEYVAGWKDYVKSLRKVDARYETEFQLAAMVLKAHEDKTYRGAMIASMTRSMGIRGEIGIRAGFGGYHLVWARDLYEVATGLMAAGDRDRLVAARSRADVFIHRAAEAGREVPAEQLAGWTRLLAGTADGRTVVPDDTGVATGAYRRGESGRSMCRPEAEFCDVARARDAAGTLGRDRGIFAFDDCGGDCGIGVRFGYCAGRTARPKMLSRYMMNRGRRAAH